jgi:hypothetical protein
MLAQHDVALYQTGAVSRATNMRQTKLERLLDRGVIAVGSQDVDASGSGSARLFTRNSVYRVALASALMNIGLPPGRAAAIAEQHAHNRGFLVVTPTGAATVRNRLDLRLEAAANILLDLDQVRADVDARIPEAF